MRNALGLVLVLVLTVLTSCSWFGGHDDGRLIWAVPVSGSDANISEEIAAVEDYISMETGLSVSIVLYDDYTALVNSLGKNFRPSDMATLPTFSYLVAAEQGLAEAAGAGVRFGLTTYSSQVITRFDSGISALADLSGTSFLRPDPLSTSGWIIPEIMMRAAGVNVDTQVTPVDAGDHTNVVIGVYEGEHDGTAVDAGACYVDARDSVDPATYPDVMTTVVVIEESIPIPNDALAFHPSVAGTMRSTVVATIQALADSSSGDALQAITTWDNLSTVDDSFYDDFRQLLADAGVNPADY